MDATRDYGRVCKAPRAALGWVAALLVCVSFPLLVGLGPALRNPVTGDRLTTTASRALRGEHLPQIVATSAEVVDARTGRLLYARRSTERRAIASITKLMTAYVVVHHMSMTRVITVSQQAAAVPGSTMGLSAGERLTVRTLLYGMLLPSGNDAATALALATAGTIPRFAVMMNTDAVRLGLRESHYVTPHGLDSPHEYSSASDVARIARDDLRIPALARIMQTRHITVRTVDGTARFDLTNTNELLGHYPGAIGVKTGTTNAAGASLVAAARRHGHTVIAVALNSDPLDRFPDGTALLNFAFASYVWPPLWAVRWETRALTGATDVRIGPVPRWQASWLEPGRADLLTVPADTG